LEYLIELDNFNGPLDLLLHLIKKENIRIEDVKIENIIEQYLNYIHKMEELDLDIASEYLTMAAELIEIKSFILLPKRENNLEEELDPREALINKLLAYQSYKDIKEELKTLESDRKNFYSKEISNLSAFKKEEVIEKDVLDTSFLIDALNKLLERKRLESPLETKVTTKEYSVTIRSKEIKELIRKNKKVNFAQLFDRLEKDYIVVSFLSILDLAKKGEIEILQDNNFNEIYLLDKGE